jgi:hypothetical protein
LASDKSGNKSEVVSRDLIWETGLRPGVADFAATVDGELGVIKLTWKRPRNAVERYLIYRSYATHPFVLCATVSGDETSWTDRQVQTSNTYVYGVKVMFDNGAESSLSKKIEAKY